MRFLWWMRPAEEADEGSGGGGGGTGNQAGADKSGTGDGKTDDVASRLAKLERDLKDERKARKAAEGKASEMEKAAQEWYARANPTKGGGKGAADADGDDAPAATSVNLLDAIMEGDAKNVRKALREMGFVDRKEADALVASARNQVVAEAKLYKQYPDLEDETSELYEKTVEHYRELAADPELRKSPKLIEIAARLASKDMERGEGGNGSKSKRKAEGRDGLRTDDDSDLSDDAEEELRRQTRIRAQQGSRGRRSAEDDDDRAGHDDLSPMQREIIAKFKAAGAPIDEEKYKKRAKAGIQLSGLPMGGRR